MGEFGVLVIRSLVFNLIFYINLVVFLVLGFWFMFTPRSWSIAALKMWARSSLWWMRLITGTRMEVRGREHIPQTGGLLAGKHQSAWDIFALLPMLADPALVLKRELTFIPVFGWFCLKFRMISVTSSTTPGSEVNSCWAPAMRTEVIDAPSSELNKTRRRLLPIVCPYPASNGSAENWA